MLCLNFKICPGAQTTQHYHCRCSDSTENIYPRLLGFFSSTRIFAAAFIASSLSALRAAVPIGDAAPGGDREGLGDWVRAAGAFRLFLFSIWRTLGNTIVNSSLARHWMIQLLCNIPI